MKNKIPLNKESIYSGKEYKRDKLGIMRFIFKIKFSAFLLVFSICIFYIITTKEQQADIIDTYILFKSGCGFSVGIILLLIFILFNTTYFLTERLKIRDQRIAELKDERDSIRDHLMKQNLL